MDIHVTCGERRASLRALGVIEDVYKKNALGDAGVGRVV
jgi:hypothetical protein